VLEMVSRNLVSLTLALCVASTAAFMTPSCIAPSAFRGSAVSRRTEGRAVAIGPLMANSKELRARVESVKNTKKITSAMRLVAAAKVRRAQDAVLKTRPFSETLQKVLGGLIQRLKKDNFDSPLLNERPVNKVLLVCMTGDRGLCGGYNAYAIKKAQARCNELKAAGVELDMVCIGTKGNTYFSKRQNVISYYPMGNAPTAEQASTIADSLLASYLSGEADRVELLYTRFTSLIASEPAVRTMLPLSPTGIETEGDEIFTMTSKDGQFSVQAKVSDPAAPQVFPKDMIFEQDPEQILSAILPLYFNGQLLRQMQESVASELAARMTAMQAASDNAKELIKTLSQQLNRQRQAAITQEIAEIVAGANS
jgi:F-type H+-transporting ATPase subunit gamma